MEDYNFPDDTRKKNIQQLQPRLDNQRIKHSKYGYSIPFIIAAFEPLDRHEFDVKTNSIKGHLCGLLKRASTEITLIFTVESKSKAAKNYL